MAIVVVDSGSLYRQTHSLSRLAWSWVSAPFYIHQMNRVNSRNGSAVMKHHKHCLGIIIIIIIIITRVYFTPLKKGVVLPLAIVETG